MDFDSAFSKTERYNWADEVEREFSVAGTEDKFSQCSQDTWLYYSTSSSLPCDDVLRPKPRARSSGRGRHRKRNKNKASKAGGNGCQRDASTTAPATRSVSEGPCSRSVVEMIQSRRKDFESCAKGHAWTSNFDEHKKQHEASNGVKKEAVSKKEKQRKEVCHQVKDGPVLIVTRRSKTSNKAQTTTPIKQTKKPKSQPQPLPQPSRTSRADTSSDWKSDKRTAASEAETSSARLEIVPFKGTDTILDRTDMQVMTKVESQ